MWNTGWLLVFLCLSLVDGKPAPKKHVTYSAKNHKSHKRTFDGMGISDDWEDDDSFQNKQTVHVTNEDSLDDMPNTAGPNPNIFGGFPENDVWGNFELPNPQTIDRLKLALKMSHHRPSYAGDQASDANDQLFGYEHHALPEYDVMETPPFQESLWQNVQLQELLKAGKRPCAPGMGSCPPVNSPHICENLNNMCGGVNAVHPPATAVHLAPPCASQILALFGCGPPTPAPSPSPPTPPPLEPQHLLPIPVKKPPPKKDDKKDDKKPEKPPNKGSKKPDKKPEKPPDKPNWKKENYPLSDFVDENDKEKDLADIMSHKKMNEGKVGLMNEEQSLALMSAIGSDLDKSLQEKIEGPKPDVFMKNDTSGVEVDLQSGNKDTAKETDTQSNVESSKENNNEGFFSDWSDWTSCERPDKTCGRGTMTRRRTCMRIDGDCDGVMQEMSSCKINTKCIEPGDQPSLLSAPANVPAKAFENTTSSTVAEPDTKLSSASPSFDNSLEQKAKQMVGMYSGKQNNTLDDVSQSKKEGSEPTDAAFTPTTGSSNSITEQILPDKRWGNWSQCDVECGVGKISRDFMCGDSVCDGEDQNHQVRSCRIKPCLDPDVENYLKDECMSHENSFRRRHGAPPLNWSNDLYKKAIEISDHLALNAVPLSNVSNYERPGLLLAYVSPTNGDIESANASCRQAIDTWYNQKENYNFKEPLLNENNRDFIQLVWKSSKLVGISRTRLPDGGAYIASIFKPVGEIKDKTGTKKDLLVKVNARKDKLGNLINRIMRNVT